MFKSTMPTSSQAMILRGNDGNERSRIRLKPFSPFPDRSTNTETGDLQLSATSPRGRCELVKFDFSVSTSSDRPVDGFQGMFAYDKKTKSYRWQICSVVPKKSIKPRIKKMQAGDFINEDKFTHSVVPKKANKPRIRKMQAGDFINEEKFTHSVVPKKVIEPLIRKMQAGDFKSEDKFTHTDFTLDDSMDSNVAESFISYQTSDDTQHFTTPAVSLIDDTKYFRTATELHGRPNSLSTLTIPPETESIDEVSYRRLEELGFRRQTTYTPDGAFIRTQQVDSPLKSSQTCSSTPNSFNNMAKLTITNMDISNVPEQKATPFKIQGFQPKPYVSGGSMRKRVSPIRQMSLLQEVKESVNWEKRIAPTHHFSRQHQGYMPMSVCFSLREGWRHKHAEIKAFVEDQLKVKVKSLRFDPLSVRSPYEGTLDRWIVTFDTADHCELAIQKGLAVDGDLVVIKSWDAVIKDEYLPEHEKDRNYPSSYILQTEKHKHILSKFLQVH